VYSARRTNQHCAATYPKRRLRLTAMEFRSLELPSRERVWLYSWSPRGRFVGDDADRVRRVITSSRTGRQRTVVSCQPSRSSKCRFWNCSPTSSPATYCVRVVHLVCREANRRPRPRARARLGHTPLGRRPTRDPGRSGPSPRGLPTAPHRRHLFLRDALLMSR
jgi:hypothetical protein